MIYDGKFDEGKEATAGLGGRWAGAFSMHRHTPYYLIMKNRGLMGVRPHKTGGGVGIYWRE